MATRDPLLSRTAQAAAEKKRKKGGRRSTVMQDQTTIEAVALAEMGKGNNLLRTHYGINLSDGQFTYRLRRAKEAAGLDKGDGFRKAWREGRSQWEEVVAAVLPQVKKRYEQEILPKFEVPRVKGASEK